MDHTFSEETQYLADTLSAAGKEIDSLRQKAEAMSERILAEKQEMREETSHSIGNLWHADAFEQLVEMNQFSTEISRDIDLYENTLREIAKLEGMLRAPYFARIDFRLSGENTPQRIYIGRGTFMQEYHIFVYDWRAPISSMFYRFGPGPASYEAPGGSMQGTISLKRQYEIKEGALQFYFDADIEILDEYLRKMLSQNASPQMKSIVETIQREQDAAIRDMAHDVLLVQGVAGSGKTSIALHRIAYLLYNGLSNGLHSQNILILSPNAVFENYIANVLPELGEENVQSFLLDELFEMVLGIPLIQTRYELLEAWILNESGSATTMKSSLTFKCSPGFKRLLDNLQNPGASIQEIRQSYARLFQDRGYFFRMAKSLTLPPDIEDIWRYTNENLESRTLFFDDASALTYLFIKRNGNEKFRHIRQVVVDEAQDYYPLHFEILKQLFPFARYTLLGDVSQTIEKTETMDFYNQVLQLFDKKKSALISLKKSFRCSNGIIRFSAAILGIPVNAFGREGEKPAMHRLDSEEDAVPIAREIADAKAAGYQSIGIICKSYADCVRLHGTLKGSAEVHILQNTADSQLTGAFLLPVYLSKGLEFDAVFIWGADSGRYHTDSDKSLLFIGCTRALHRLRLFYAGEQSPLIGDDILHS